MRKKIGRLVTEELKSAVGWVARKYAKAGMKGLRALFGDRAMDVHQAVMRCIPEFCTNITQEIGRWGKEDPK